MQLTVLNDTYAICRLDQDAEIPRWVHASHGFASITYTQDEMSVVSDQKYVPGSVKQDRDWRILKIVGPLDFNMVGVISSITGILADAGISLFNVSTYETDFIMVKQQVLDHAIKALEDAGMEIL